MGGVFHKGVQDASQESSSSLVIGSSLIYSHYLAPVVPKIIVVHSVVLKSAIITLDSCNTTLCTTKNCSFAHKSPLFWTPSSLRKISLKKWL